MSPLYNFLGMTVGVIQHDLDPAARRAAYQCLLYGAFSMFWTAMPLVLEAPEVPFALYGEDELESESCSDCRNCCRTSAVDVSDELLVLLVEDELPVDDELLADDAPPWWPPP